MVQQVIRWGCMGTEFASTQEKNFYFIVSTQNWKGEPPGEVEGSK